jgi:MFS family permease
MVADRFDRRMVLLVTDIARGVLMLALVAAVVLDASVVVIVAISILAACFSTFFGPAIAALLPTLVDERDLGPANSAWATLDNLAFIIGPGLAGLLLAAGGLELAFLLNAISFGIVAVVLWRLPVAPAASPVADMDPNAAETVPSAGWRELLRPLAGPFVLDSATSLVAGGLGVMTVILSIDVLGAGEAGTGYLNAAFGVGGVVAGVAGGALLARRLRVPLVLGGLIGGIGLAWLGLSEALVPAMFAIGIAVAGLLLLEIVNTTLIQRIVPDRLRGRAVGVLQTSSSLLYALGSLVMPILASEIGVAPVLIASAVITVLGAGAALVLAEPEAEPGPLSAAQLRLLEHPIFAGLPPGRLEGAARRMVEVPVTAGTEVVRQGAPADRFYLVDAGRLRVSQSHDGAPVALRVLGPGDVFGEIGLLERTPRTATVTALDDGNLLALDGRSFLELVGSGPGLSTRLLDLYRGALSR